MIYSIVDRRNEVAAIPNVHHTAVARLRQTAANLAKNGCLFGPDAADYNGVLETMCFSHTGGEQGSTG